MKLGINAAAFGKRLKINMDLVHHAETLGFDSAWTAEAYGNDAITTATWIAARTEKLKVGTAIMQMPARTPAMTAMTAISLDQLSGGRFILGLGPSGPQVVSPPCCSRRPVSRTSSGSTCPRACTARRTPTFAPAEA